MKAASVCSLNLGVILVTGQESGAAQRTHGLQKPHHREILSHQLPVPHKSGYCISTVQFHTHSGIWERENHCL